MTGTAALTRTPKPKKTRTPTSTITRTRTPTSTVTATRTPTKKPTRTSTPNPKVTLGSTLTSSPTSSSIYYPPATWTPIPIIPTLTNTILPATSVYFTAIVQTHTPTPSLTPIGEIQDKTPTIVQLETETPQEGFVQRFFSQPWVLILVALATGVLGVIVIGVIIWLLFLDKPGEDGSG